MGREGKTPIVVVLLKACAHCEGDLQIGSDVYGLFRKCVQCGHEIPQSRDHAYVVAAATAQVVEPAKKTSKIEAA